ncbi:MAG: 16S rRNA (adenine(1518)-N(6)/adenine(1519)-N(6))-dimethyltransferase RsmA [Ruminococcaceae bacterium]|nr:16S rRNA (adenine(1518)-N(6)/adenine(1519)-N(6))-dimethyltransferase RsmA [Oscillospiraceae bacterium]
MNLCDQKTIKQLMAMFSLNFRKEFGQNFLTNVSVVEDIADNCCDDSESTVLEIGPGVGSLTRELAVRYKRVIAVEIDNGLIPVLKYTLGEFSNVTVINEDVMKLDLEELLAPAFARGKVSVCANLPYYITTPILMKLLESGLPFDSITVMIQSEVADRLCAVPGGKNCGAITAVLNYYGEPRRLFRVGAHNFVPPPKVESSVIRIDLYKERPYRPLDEAIFFRTVKGAFEQRRKTLPNALSAAFGELSKEELTEIIVSCGHSPDVRGERLTVEDFRAIADEIYRRTRAES